MARIVKGILKEELQRVKALKKQYEGKIAQCPPGYLLERKKQGQKYYYLSYREGERIRQEYLGKLSDKELKDYQNKMKLKKLLRQQLKEVKDNIRYLEKIIKK